MVKNDDEELINENSYSMSNACIYVKTFRNKKGKLFYRIHIGKKYNNRWYNSNLKVQDSDLNILFSLIQKTRLERCSIRYNS